MPGQQQFAPPPPPSIPPAAAPSTFADFAPPTPPEPAVQYGSPAPSEPSASRFGGYAGPPDAFAAPPANPFGAPPVAYGTPTWSTQPPKKKGSRLWAKVLGAVFAVIIGLGVLVRLDDVATMHHVASTMPTTLADATQVTGPEVDAVVAQMQAKNSTDNYRFKSLHAAIYSSGTARVVAMVGDVPSGGQRHVDDFFQGMAHGAGAAAQPFHAVPGGPKGGGMECAAMAAGGVICAWVDNGTAGFVVTNGDESGALMYTNALRVSMET